MYPEVIRNTLTLPRVLGGISKTLGVIREAIPIYEQAKPLWNNAKTALQVLKVMNTPDEKKSSNKAKVNKIKEIESTPSISGPQFFQ